VWDEFVVFQGATYFRGVGRGQSYGISARGLAIATGEPQGEEFPYFSKFWVERPASGQMDLVVHALMDSPSVTGAYRFTITPGESTVMDVTLTLFPRSPITAIGIAPLTSMFLFDQTNRRGYDDFRNAVHDSDGLQILNGAGELIWRPLANPRRLQMSAFVDENPRGFGLMQRKRDSDDFNDFTARYEDRPSLWVEPVGDWGRGSVVLVEIPTERETNDNIVAFWRPRTPIAAGQPYSASYRLYWGEDAPIGSTLMRVAHTRTGASLASKRFFVVDFDGADSDIPLEEVTVVSSASRGAITEPHLVRDDRSGVIRATFELDPENQPLTEIRLQLMAGGEPASETWLYRWTPG
jgi:glucans biosynthesis protein